MVMEDKFMSDNSICAFYMNKKSVNFISPVMIEAENQESAREIMISSFMLEISKKIKKINDIVSPKKYYYRFLRNANSYVIQKIQEPHNIDGSFLVMSQKIFYLEDSRRDNEFHVPRHEIYSHINHLISIETNPYEENKNEFENFVS
jgi:GTPase SAR1 family protein